MYAAAERCHSSWHLLSQHWVTFHLMKPPTLSIAAWYAGTWYTPPVKYLPQITSNVSAFLQMKLQSGQKQGKSQELHSHLPRSDFAARLDWNRERPLPTAALQTDWKLFSIFYHPISSNKMCCSSSSHCTRQYSVAEPGSFLDQRWWRSPNCVTAGTQRKRQQLAFWRCDCLKTSIQVCR